MGGSRGLCLVGVEVEDTTEVLIVPLIVLRLIILRLMRMECFYHATKRYHSATVQPLIEASTMGSHCCRESLML